MRVGQAGLAERGAEPRAAPRRARWHCTRRIVLHVAGRGRRGRAVQARVVQPRGVAVLDDAVDVDAPQRRVVDQHGDVRRRHVRHADR